MAKLAQDRSTNRFGPTLVERSWASLGHGHVRGQFKERCYRVSGEISTAANAAAKPSYVGH